MSSYEVEDIEAEEEEQWHNSTPPKLTGLELSREGISDEPRNNVQKEWQWRRWDGVEDTDLHT